AAFLHRVVFLQKLMRRRTAATSHSRPRVANANGNSSKFRGVFTNEPSQSRTTTGSPARSGDGSEFRSGPAGPRPDSSARRTGGGSRRHGFTPAAGAERDLDQPDHQRDL